MGSVAPISVWFGHVSETNKICEIDIKI